MHPDSGQVYRDILEADAKKHGLVPIPAEEEATVQRMNRHQRRAWAAKRRRAEGSGG